MLAQSPATALNQSARQLSGAQARHEALSVLATRLLKRKAELEESCALIKARIEMAPKATEVLEYLQEAAHTRAVGELETGLSELIEDVMPEEGTVRLTLGTERGAPALDLSVVKDGNEEDILEGNGGALTNIVVMGLSYATLARTQNRRLMVLDEPDCWMPIERMEAFSNVIADVSAPTIGEDGTAAHGCQTLMITHTSPDFLTEKAHKVTLVKSKGSVDVGYSIGAKAWVDDSQEGIRWIEATNLRRHKNTRLELSPGLNIITGDGNTGKSTLLITALRAMGYGESTDSHIRHGMPYCKVRIGVENGYILELERQRRGTPKLVYRLYQGSTLLRESRQESRNTIPPFIDEVFRVRRVDGLDLQLRSQKTPVFLLNEPPARRAQLLSIGRESGLLQEAIEAHRLQLRRDGRQLDADEIELNQVNRQLLALSPLTGLATLSEVLEGLHQEAAMASDAVVKMRKSVDTLAPLYEKQSLVAFMAAAAVDAPGRPVLSDTSKLRELTKTIATSLPFSKIPTTLAKPEAPKPPVAPRMRELIAVLERGKAFSQLGSILCPVPAVPVLTDTQVLRKTGVELAELYKAQDTIQKQQVDASNQVTAAKDALTALRKEIGHCPLCQSSFGEAHHHA